jgi:hypothetical protein
VRAPRLTPVTAGVRCGREGPGRQPVDATLQVDTPEGMMGSDRSRPPTKGNVMSYPLSASDHQRFDPTSARAALDPAAMEELFLSLA